MKNLSIGITTRNRPQAIVRCVRSLAALQPVTSRVFVFDDASDEPVSPIVMTASSPDVPVTVMRDDRQAGYIDGRNRIVAQADTPFVLLLDDDAVVLAADAIMRGIGVLERDPNVAAIAFAQGEADGRPWPDGMQPGRGQDPAYVAAFIGFAHLLRRDVFLRLGGYRTALGFYGEEKDFCIRVLDAGLRVVYLPDALVAHVPDPAGRSTTKYVRFVIRNDCLYSLFNEPWPLVALGLPVRLLRYRRMVAGRDAESGGMRWILTELARLLPEVRRGRRAVSWATIREWRRLVRRVVPYEASAS